MSSKVKIAEWTMLVTVIAVTLLISLSAIRYYAPQWLGLPSDLVLVKAAVEVPPFYDGIFRSEDLNSTGFLINDPYTVVRAHPLVTLLNKAIGPTDILGFRNAGVPGYTDVLVIGDSQTFGNNASLSGNWPSQLQEELAEVGGKVYSMATGGWGAVQYFYMFSKGMALRPRVVVVAFYSGNDPLESYNVAYQVDYWRNFREPLETDGDILPPPIAFPVPESTWWSPAFSSGEKMDFTPAYRLRASQVEYPAVRAGWNIMAKVAKLLNEFSEAQNVHIVFTVIPTKELVYAKRIAQDGIALDLKYRELIEKEKINIDEFADGLRTLSPRPDYVDLVAPMQQAALKNFDLYPRSINGHPFAAGYAVIADAIAPVVSAYLKKPPGGLLKVSGSNGTSEYVLFRENKLYPFGSEQLVIDNGWDIENINTIPSRHLFGLNIQTAINSVDRGKYGPP